MVIGNAGCDAGSEVVHDFAHAVQEEILGLLVGPVTTWGSDQFLHFGTVIVAKRLGNTDRTARRSQT